MAIARGLCRRHYQAAWKADALDVHARLHWGRGTRPCSVEHCRKSIYGGARGLCPMHYRRWQREQERGTGLYGCSDCGHRFATLKAASIHRSRMHGYGGDRDAALQRYLEAHRKQIIARANAWKASHRERHRELCRFKENRRRARKIRAQGTASAAQLDARIAFYGWRCWICGAPWEHLDHVIPLARGGSNWPSNFRPACASCNRHKHTTMPHLVARVRP